MLDPKLIRHQPDAIKDSLIRRGMDPGVIDRLSELDRRRRDLIQQSDQLKQQRNDVSRELGRRKKAGEDISAESARMREVGEEILRQDEERQAVEQEHLSLLECLPNLPSPEVPDGQDDASNVELRCWGAKGTGDFKPVPHWDLGEALDIMDFKRASKITGSRFWVLKGAGARLERALISYFLDIHTLKHGYTEVMPPSLVNRQSLYGTGQLPRFEEDLFKIDDPERQLYLSPTSEVPVTNLHAQEILELSQLPIHYCAFSSCFRSEAGAAGRDTRGLIRVHEFHKVELVKICVPETSYAELDGMVADAERLLQGLEIPYRVVKVCLGDLGYTAALKYDLEFWSAAQERWIEISSCSNCADYQARRAGIRFKRSQAASPEFCHTLNGSGLAVGRTMVAILENHQNADGSVNIPAVLQPYMGGQSRIGPG